VKDEENFPLRNSHSCTAKKMIDRDCEEVDFSELPERIRRNVAFLLRGEKERLWGRLLPSERENLKSG